MFSLNLTICKLMTAVLMDCPENMCTMQNMISSNNVKKLIHIFKQNMLSANSYMPVFSSLALNNNFLYCTWIT